MSELYELPDGWEWKKLGEVGKITTGNTPSKKEKKYWDNGEYFFIKPPHLGSSISTLDTEEKLTEVGFLKAKPIPKNSIMVCCIGSLGKVGIADRKLATNQQINSITFFKDTVDFKYGYYFAITLEKKMNKMANKAVVAIINKSTFSNIYFPLPPLQEQKRIVAKLDTLFEKIDKSIALHQKNMDEADIFMGSVLNDVFENLKKRCKWKKLDELTEVNIGKTPTRSKKEFFLGDKVWLSIRDLKGLYVSTSNEMITDEAINVSNIKIVKKGTLLMSFKLTLGRTAFADCDLYTNEAIASLPIKDKSILNKYFLNYSLGVIDLEKEVDNAIKGKTLNKQKLKNLDIPIPPLAIQQKTVIYLDKISQKIENLKSVQKEKMQNLIDLKASILDKTFRGEI